MPESLSGRRGTTVRRLRGAARRTIDSRRLGLSLLAAFCLFFARGTILPAIGGLLVVDEPLGRADVIVIAPDAYTDGVVCEKSAGGLRGLAVVELEHAAEALMAPHRACSCRCGRSCDELVAETLVRPFLMIMIDERTYGGPEVRFAEWHDTVQALGFDGQDKPLGKRVQIWTPRWQEHWCHATVSQQVPEDVGVERIPIQNDVLNVAQKAVAGIGQVPSELRHPGLVRLRGDPGDLHGAGLELHDEEDDVADQSAQGQHRR